MLIMHSNLLVDVSVLLLICCVKTKQAPSWKCLLHFQLFFSFICWHFGLWEGLEIPSTYFSCDLFLHHAVVCVPSSLWVPAVLSSRIAIREGSHQAGEGKVIPGLACSLCHACKSKTTAGVTCRQISKARAVFTSITAHHSTCSLHYILFAAFEVQNTQTLPAWCPFLWADMERQHHVCFPVIEQFVK